MNVKSFDIRRGELPQFLRAFAVLLLTIAGHTVLETARDALFLTKLEPSKLAFVYVAVALSSLLLAPLSELLTKAVGVRNALIVTLLLAASGACGFRLLPSTAGAVVALYVFCTLSATLLIGQFWMFAGQLFSGSQNRRLFGPLASGGVLGAVFGAGVASLLVAHFPLRALLIVASLCYVCAALTASTLRAASPAPASRALEDGEGTGLARLRRDPFVLRLAAGAALSASIAVIIDYAYKAQISASIPHAQLGSFFARYQLCLNLVSLALQVGITGPLVERLGVLGVALFPPALLALVSAGAALLPRSFWPFVLLKATDSALRNSLSRVGNELLWSPVENQARARSVIDVVVSRSAQAAIGVLLLALASQTQGALRLLAAGAACLSLLWLGNGIGLRAPYIELFRRAIRRGSLARDWVQRELDLTAVETLVEALAQPVASNVLAAIDLLEERGRSRLIPALILYHREEAVLLRSLELFAAGTRTDWFPLGEELLSHSSNRVRLGAVRALGRRARIDALRRTVGHGDPAMRAFATLYLAQLEGSKLEGDPLTWELFANDSEGHPLKRAFVEAVCESRTPGASKLLLQFARVPELQAAVTQALTTTADESAIEFLLHRLVFVESRAAARQALVKIGDAALSTLLRESNRSDRDRRIALHIPRTLASFENDVALRALLDMLSGSADGLLRYKALRAIEQIALRTTLPIPSAPINAEIERNSIEYLRLFALNLAIRNQISSAHTLEFTLLTELLADKLDQALDRLSRLLQIANRTDDIRMVFAALRSDDVKQRSRGLEFLDASIRKFGPTSDDLAVLFRLVVDDLPDAVRVERASGHVGIFANVRDALEHLSQTQSSVLRTLAVQARLCLMSTSEGEASAALSAKAEGLA